MSKKNIFTGQAGLVITSLCHPLMLSPSLLFLVLDKLQQLLLLLQMMMWLLLLELHLLQKMLWLIHISILAASEAVAAALGVAAAAPAAPGEAEQPLGLE